MEFQILEVIQTNINNEYVIELYGRDSDNRTICCTVNGFTPFFYILIPDRWDLNDCDRLITSMKIIPKPKMTIMQKYKFYGFTNKRQFKFLRLVFKSSQLMMYCAKECKKIKGIEVYESNIKPYTRFFHIRGINPSDWVQTTKYTYNTRSRCQINIATEWTNLSPLNKQENGIYKTACFDIECEMPKNKPYKFPLATSERIIQIGMTIDTTSYIVNLGTMDSLENIIVINCDTEESLIQTWAKIIRDEDPDIIMGYNTFGFDYSYIQTRCKILNIDLDISRIPEKTNYIEKQLESSALGMNILKYYIPLGRINIDIMKLVQQNKNLSSYKLDSVTKELLQEELLSVKGKVICMNVNIDKMDYIRISQYNEYTEMTNEKYKIVSQTTQGGNTYCVLDKRVTKMIDINNKMKIRYTWSETKARMDFDNTTPEEMGKYCIQDCKLCVKLYNKLKIFENNMAMAKICCVPMSVVLFGGQGQKIISMVSRLCRETNYLIPTIDQPSPNPYKGGETIIPIPNIYYESVGVLDYTSLYPSIMICYNMSHEYVLLDEYYNNIPGFKYTKIENSVFVKKESENNLGTDQKTLGIIPRLLCQLLESRKRVSSNSPMGLAYKTVANAMIGYCGSIYSELYMREIAASCTSIGRTMLLFAKDFIETEYHLKVIYGNTDSVFFLTNLPVRESIELSKKISEDLSNKLPEPLKIKYEYVLNPMGILAKNQYFGKMYTNDENTYSAKITGIVLAKCDYPPIVKLIYSYLLDDIMNKHKNPKEKLNEYIQDIHNGKYSTDMFILNKTLKKTYNTQECTLHVGLAKRIALRDPGNKPNYNDKISYVFVKNISHIEDPTYVTLQKMQIDYEHYTKTQIRPLCKSLLNLE